MKLPGASHGPHSSRQAFRLAPNWMARVAAVFTLPLLFVGGSVTTYRVGLAVPDWPSTFGINMFVYDFWNASFGVFVEHTHRLYGAAVGLLTLLLAIFLALFDRRKWMKTVGAVALAAVILQGILGGTRVTQVSTTLAAVHGCTGQAFFGLMVALCVLTGKDWLSDRRAISGPPHLRAQTVTMLGIVYLQIVFGAWLRHFGTLPALVAHGVLALVVLASAALLSVRVWRNRRAVPLLLPSALCVGAGAVLQVLLGIGALVYLLPFGGVPGPVHLYEAIIRTGHQTNAAILLGATVVLTLRAIRHMDPAVRASNPDHLTSTSESRAAPRNLEAVA